MTEQMHTPLKPCPFCGSDDLMLFCDPDEGRDNSGPARRIQCAGCNIEAPFYPTDAEASAAWNRRADAASSQERIAQLEGDLKWMRDRDDKNGSLPPAYRARIDAALAEAAPAPEGWKPIETAPTDGTTVFVWGPYEDEPVAVQWRRNKWMAIWDGYLVIEYQSDQQTDYRYAIDPTHWMPLPAAPERIVGAAK